MNIAIVDDERPSRSELRYLIQKFLPYATIEEVSSGRGLIEKAMHTAFDVVFLDINLGDIQGMELASLVRGMLPQVSIVFATAYDEFAVKAFEMEAVDYVMKPFEEKRLELTMKKIMTRYKKKQIENKEAVEEKYDNGVEKLVIDADKKLNLVDLQDIAYIEVVDRMCKIHTRRGVLQTMQPLKYFEEKLSHKHFFRIHKSYMINLKYVVEIEPSFNSTYVVKLKGFEKESLVVSRNHIKGLKEAFLS